MKKLKIYGERNTGTNYFIKLVDAHLSIPLYDGNSPTKKIAGYTVPTGSNVFQNTYFGLTWNKNLGWKHSLVKVDKLARHRDIDDTYFCTLSKNPYSFLLSLHKRPYHYKGDRSKPFEEFLKEPWEVQSRDNANQKFYKNPIELWNKKTESYIHLKNTFQDRVINLKYEDLIADPEKILADIGQQYQIDHKQPFANLTASTKRSEKTYYDYKDYYLKEKWRKKLSREAIGWINSQLDTEVMNYFGYDFIDL